MQYGANIVPVPDNEKEDYAFPREKGLLVGACNEQWRLTSGAAPRWHAGRLGAGGGATIWLQGKS